MSDEFKQAVSNLGGVVHYGLPNATKLWQPMDADYTQLLKSLGQTQRRWLDDKDNAEKWYGLHNLELHRERKANSNYTCTGVVRHITD